MESTFGRRAIVNAALLSTWASLFSYAGGMVVSILVARTLGPGDYGHYAYVVWLSGLMVTLFAAGFNGTVMRFTSEYVGRGAMELTPSIRSRLRRSMLLAMAVGVVGIVLAWPWVGPKDLEEGRLGLCVLVIVAFVTKASFMFEASAAKGYGRFWIEAVCLIVLSLANVSVVAALWLHRAGLAEYLVWFASFNVAHLLMIAVLTRGGPAAATAPALDPELTARIKKHLFWSVVLAFASVFASKSFEVFLLNATAGPKEVAYFTIGLSLTRSGVDLVVGGLSSVLIPLMSHAYGAGGGARVGSIFGDAARYFQFVGLMLCGVGYFLAEPVVMLMYGQQYRPVVVALQVIVVGSCSTLSMGAYSALLSATENQRLRVWFSTLSMGISGLLALAFVPWMHLTGALISMTASNWLGSAAMIVLVRRMTGFMIPFRPIGRQFAACLPAFGMGILVERLTPVAGGVLGGLAYVVAFGLGSLLTGTWSAKETLMAASALANIRGLRRLSSFIAARGVR